MEILKDGTYIVNLLYDYSVDYKNAEKIFINESCSRITRNAKCDFEMCEKLKEITVPSSVYHIDEYVFCHCRNLESVYLSKNLETLENGAFYDCSSLRFINLPDSLDYIGDHVFEGCENLKELVIPPNVYNIGKEAFCGSGINKLVLPDNKDLIFSDDAFDACPVKTIKAPKRFHHKFIYMKENNLLRKDVNIIYYDEKQQVHSNEYQR